MHVTITLPIEESVVNELDTPDQVPTGGALPLTNAGMTPIESPEQVEPIYARMVQIRLFSELSSCLNANPKE
jgi:hypothetical protein